MGRGRQGKGKGGGKPIEYAKFDDRTMRLLSGSGTTVNFAADPPTYMADIHDFDGNDLGGASS